MTKSFYTTKATCKDAEDMSRKLYAPSAEVAEILIDNPDLDPNVRKKIRVIKDRLVRWSSDLLAEAPGSVRIIDDD